MRGTWAIVVLGLSVWGREVAITVDDVPRPGDRAGVSGADTRRMTEKLVEPFHRLGIPVVAFVNECWSPGTVHDILRLWVAAGAELGNHTCSHLDLNTTPLPLYLADIDKGDAAILDITGARPRYFRHPFLHTGSTREIATLLDQSLRERGYQTAPVTVSNDDYVFAAVYGDALNRKDRKEANRVRREYIAHLAEVFAFFEERSKAVAGHEVRQILLIHANQLNADSITEILSMLENRRYRFIKLSEALQDPAYQMRDDFGQPNGWTWIHRWSKAKGMPPKGEPEPPADIRDAYSKLNSLRRN